VSQFIAQAAPRLGLLAHQLIRRHAPDFAGQTDALFSEAYQRLVASLQNRLPPANPDEYFNIAAVQIRFALKDLIREKLNSQRHAPGEVLSDVAADSTAPPEKVARSESCERLLLEIEQLPDALRRYLDLHWTQGLTHVECARILGVSEKQAKTLWEKIKLILGRRLGDSDRGT
jgi:RNA polymerase sigma factor (sigma-70 family)